MLDTETIKNISTFVEIAMQVEERLRDELPEEEQNRIIALIEKAGGEE